MGGENAKSYLACMFNVIIVLTLLLKNPCALFTAPGIYSSIEMLDFGTLRSQGKSTSYDISKTADAELK